MMKNGLSKYNAKKIRKKLKKWNSRFQKSSAKGHKCIDERQIRVGHIQKSNENKNKKSIQQQKNIHCRKCRETSKKRRLIDIYYRRTTSDNG
jgi:hypothetical protein